MRHIDLLLHAKETLRYYLMLHGNLDMIDEKGVRNLYIGVHSLSCAPYLQANISRWKLVLMHTIS